MVESEPVASGVCWPTSNWEIPVVLKAKMVWSKLSLNSIKKVPGVLSVTMSTANSIRMRSPVVDS